MGDRPRPDRLIALGRVIDAWGVRGWVKVETYANAQDSVLVQAGRWHLRREASPAHAAIDAWCTIDRARRHSGTVVARPQGCEDRTAALALKGCEVGVHRADFPALPVDEFYWVDLVGCAVSNPAGEPLGSVTTVDDHGAHPILCTDRDLLIPFVERYVVEVDPASARIVVDWQADWSR